MFTGIIEARGEVVAMEPQHPEGKRLKITWSRERRPGETTPSAGDSVAVDGVCLTVSEPLENGFWADVSQETLARSTLARRRRGDRVNLESSLKAGQSMGGHFVTGHVDDVVQISDFRSRGDYYDLTVRFDPQFRSLIAPKGSVALDGISLTVNEVEADRCTVRIVPYTFQQTTLEDRGAGDELNLEVDMLSRYVYNYLNQYISTQDSLSPSDLSDAGF